MLRKWITAGVLCSPIFFLMACQPDTTNQIPVISVDKDGNPVQVTMNGKDYSNQLGKILRMTNDSTLPALNRSGTQNGWRLRTAAVGIGVNMGVGVGLASIAMLPRVRLIFTNSSDPTLP